MDMDSIITHLSDDQRQLQYHYQHEMSQNQINQTNVMKGSKNYSAILSDHVKKAMFI